MKHIKRPTFAGAITVVLKSATDVSGGTNVPGITNKHCTKPLFKETIANLARGLNGVTFAYRMPACSDLYRGAHHPNTSVVYGNVTVANSTDTTLS